MQERVFRRIQVRKRLRASRDEEANDSHQWGQVFCIYSATELDAPKDVSGEAPWPVIVDGTMQGKGCSDEPKLVHEHGGFIGRVERQDAAPQHSDQTFAGDGDGPAFNIVIGTCDRGVHGRCLAGTIRQVSTVSAKPTIFVGAPRHLSG